MNSAALQASFDWQVFSHSYQEARRCALQQVSQMSDITDLFHYQVEVVPGVDEELFTDSIYIGASEAPHGLVLLTGTHGIEGFAGSAVLRDILSLYHTGLLKPSADIAILVVHALNPWGYAMMRRCDENGVDLNRNFVDFSQSLPANAGYEQIRGLLKNPNSQQRSAGFKDWITQYGQAAFESAVSQGQYTDSEGPFYGGTFPVHGRQVTEALFERYRLADKSLAVIDLHTGLGSFGYGEVICDHGSDTDGERMARQWYGESVTLPDLGTSSSVPKEGLLDYAWHAIMNKNSCYVTLEFGTYPTENLFQVLIDDHLIWAQNKNPEALRHQQQAMLRHFYPQDTAWRQLLLFRSRQVILQAIEGLTQL